MNTVIPAIIPTTREHLERSLATVGSFTDIVQIDIVDGIFVPTISWPYGADEAIGDIESFTSLYQIEVDLMVQNPEMVIPLYHKAGVTQMVVHLESTSRIDEVIRQKNELDCTIGFSIGNNTPLDMLYEYIAYADYIQLMGIREIGMQGNAFDERVLLRIQELRHAYPNLNISIDGSVTPQTLPRLIEAGATRFVSGSYIMSAQNPKEAYDTLTHL